MSFVLYGGLCDERLHGRLDVLTETAVMLSLVYFALLFLIVVVLHVFNFFVLKIGGLGGEGAAALALLPRQVT